MTDRFFWRRSGRLWILGAVLLALRLWQDRTGFDPDTGLAIPGFPGTALVVCLLLYAAVEALLALRLPRGRGVYAEQFDPPDRGLAAAVAGCLLLSGGGAVLIGTALTVRGILPAITGALGLAAGGGLLLLLRRAKAGRDLRVGPVLPVMFFGVAFVLLVYVPAESDPVLARTYLPVLSAAMAAFAFSQLGGSLSREGSLRAFVFTGDLAVPLCLAAVADGGLAQRLLYTGCALTLSVFLLLRRESARRGRHEAAA